MLSPEAVCQVTWFNRLYLQCVTQGDDRPSVFYMVGCITHCQIRRAPVSKKTKTNYQVCIVPFDWAWDRIYSNIAAVTPTAQFIIPTYMGGVSFITSGSPILLFFYAHFYFHPVYSDSNAEAKAPSFNGPVHHAAPFHAKNGSSCFSFKGICTLNNIEDKLHPLKKKANGYTTAISFNIHNIVQLSDEPATGDDCVYGADDDSSDDVFV
ncbi:hypothetical protein M422DRAFT_263084 [Sphaerobolus stellatus SS14]|uniref:Uncharacterized protein n=1 Tax=Sphaerobolus stellatus (strain SS14) TaxID=990650 RepID=A0A0C9UZJ2_SPHS4|nr:hypothetical protein M422DRAFT_263084 [Sphaerobolus stellatus SS14]